MGANDSMEEILWSKLSEGKARGDREEEILLTSTEEFVFSGENF